MHVHAQVYAHVVVEQLYYYMCIRIICIRVINCSSPKSQDSITLAVKVLSLPQYIYSCIVIVELVPCDMRAVRLTNYAVIIIIRKTDR